MRRILLVLLGLLGLLIAAYAIAVVTAQPVPPHPYFTRFADATQPLIIAHQGGDGLRPSNTLMAFEHAVALGADVLEMDIHSSADGVLVVIHDDTVDRTTDGSGRVNALSYADIQRLDAAYHWPTLDDSPYAGSQPFRGQGVTIPALADVLDAFPDMPMVIEIKQPEPPITGTLCDLLREKGMAEQVLVGSFHGAVLREFRQVCPEVATSSDESEVTVFFALNTVGLHPAYHPVSHAFQVPEYSGNFHVLTDSFIAHAQGHNIDVQAWTINSDEDIARMIGLGVNGIITDYPDRVLRALGRPVPELDDRSDDDA